MTKTASLPTDQHGYRPTGQQECDNGADCKACAGLGWMLCHHENTEIELDLGNPDGHHEWCAGCDSPAEGPAWRYCPERIN